jgi:hypothetical protein
MLSVESLGAEFCGQRDASSNYGIGADGRVALYVPESCRSHCSSSRDNDQRAVTIECADEAKWPYKFSDTVYNKLVDLCVDICRRNGKNKLIWIGDKTKAISYEPAANEMVLTVHRWFMNTQCPGEWLMQHMADLASKVTAALAADKPLVSYSGTASTGTVSDEQTIWDYFMKKFNNAYGVAGLMGNLYAESGLRSNNLEDSKQTKLGHTDTSYTSSVDNNTYLNFVNDGAGYGLAQWTYNTRKQALLSYTHGKQKSICDLATQLEFLYKELSESYKTVVSALKTAKTVQEASDIVLTKYEAPKDQSSAVKSKRRSYGETYYKKYAVNQTVPQYGLRVLRRGMRGEDVKHLQEDLMTLGYKLPKYGADTDFGAETEAAVRKFQKDNALVIDGVAGNATISKLAELLKGGSVTVKKELAVGDIVSFTGSSHYVSAYSTNPKSCKPGKAKITVIHKTSGSKHPYHLVAVNGGGSTVCGWVDENNIKQG